MLFLGLLGQLARPRESLTIELQGILQIPISLPHLAVVTKREQFSEDDHCHVVYKGCKIQSIQRLCLSRPRTANEMLKQIKLARLANQACKTGCAMYICVVS